MDTKLKGKKYRRWSDLTARQQTAVLALAAVQLSLAATAWTDLRNRPEAQINGRKSLWAVAVAFNFVGPVLYFIKGIRR